MIMRMQVVNSNIVGSAVVFPAIFSLQFIKSDLVSHNESIPVTSERSNPAECE